MHNRGRLIRTVISLVLLLALPFCIPDRYARGYFTVFLLTSMSLYLLGTLLYMYVRESVKRRSPVRALVVFTAPELHVFHLCLLGAAAVALLAGYLCPEIYRDPLMHKVWVVFLVVNVAADLLLRRWQGR